MEGKTNRDVRKWVFLSTIILVALFGAYYESLAQNAASQQVTIVVPEVLRLQVDRAELDFTQGTVNDGYLYPSGGEHGQNIKVFSNVERKWQLKVQSDANEALEWSTDGMNWRSAVTGEETVAMGVRTKGWENHRVYLRLRSADASVNPRVQVAYELTAVPVEN